MAKWRDTASHHQRVLGKAWTQRGRPGEGADIATTMIYVHHVPRHDAAAKLSTALRLAASPAIEEMEESAVDRGAR